MRIQIGLFLLGISLIDAFVAQSSRTSGRKDVLTMLRASSSSSKDDAMVEPQVVASGYSQAIEMVTALEEAVDMALEALPSAALDKIDLAVVSVSSLYDGNASPSEVVPTLLKEAPGIQNVIGCTSGGFISSLANFDYSPDAPACRPIEREGVPGVTVTLMVLPDVNLKTFHVNGAGVPDNYSKTSSEDWKAAVGLDGLETDATSAALIFPSPAFQPDLTDLLRGLEMHVTPTIVGAIASTVSSLSRARLFRYTKDESNCVQTLADGCVGVVLKGDIQIESMVAQGAKPVGGVYQIVKGQESTINSIALDEAATEIVQQDEESADDDHDNNDESEGVQDAKAQMAKAYAKARIPKPVLAEANFLMRNLGDDERAFMTKILLVGLERKGGRNPSDLIRLAEGKGPGFTVHQVASAGTKDGSVTLSLGSVDIKAGQRLRFYVREASYAKKELWALWAGYQHRLKGGQILWKSSNMFNPAGCLIFPTLDRGNKFFMGKSGFESSTVTELLPTIPSVSGFYGNGVIGRLDSDPDSGGRESSSLSGSASGYVLVGSRSGRPIYIPSKASAEDQQSAEEEAAKKAAEERLEQETKAKEARIKSFETSETKAPRDEYGELVLRRREIHSGRAMTVSTVEWSVADKTASPTSAIEGYMWDKETEVDRFRERVPLSNLVSQCRLSSVDPSKPKPRDWVGPVRTAAKNGFVIIPECKRMEPGTGSLRKRYDVAKLTKEFTASGVPAISVNCDGILFGGSLEDISTAKAAIEYSGSKENTAVPPILASDLLLYPYQLYQLRLAGADAVNLLGVVLQSKDLVYLTKIARSLLMQCLVTVTSSKQIEDLSVLPAGSLDGLIVSNRNLEDFTLDTTGQQALDILSSEAMKKFREKHGEDGVVVLAEGRVGVLSSAGGSSPKGLHQNAN